eukprot:4145665-Pyramimonas_sp.AAC.1
MRQPIAGAGAELQRVAPLRPPLRGGVEELLREALNGRSEGGHPNLEGGFGGRRFDEFTFRR